MRSLPSAAVTVVLILFARGISPAQTRLDSLRPAPRQAYVRLTVSGVFEPNPLNPIFLDRAAPAYGAADMINAFLRGKGKPALPIAMASPADSSAAGIFIGVCDPFLNRMLESIPDQRVQATPAYPGREGYVLDVMPARAILAGSDTAGLRYAVDTFLQLLAAAPAGWLHACRIVDAPQFPKRWFYHSTNVQVGANVTAAKRLWARALKARLNGVNLNDSKFHRMTTLPGFYFDSLASLKRWADQHSLEIIPGVFPFGYSEGMLFHDPNLASGLPVKGQKFLIHGDTGVLVPQLETEYPNGGFENFTGHSFPGFLFIDRPGQMSFADTVIRHSGRASIRFENLSLQQNARAAYRTRVRPFTLYRFSAWVRTDDLQPPSSARMAVIGNKGYNLCFNSMNLPSTTNGWRKCDISFNSLEADTVTLYCGAWSPRSGTIWWDDLSCAETYLVNLIRRDGAPLTITNPEGSVSFVEGKDFDTLRDPRMGVNPWPGSFDTWHTPPTFRVKPGGALSDGDSALVSYCHAVTINEDQVMITMSDPQVYEIAAREFAALDSIISPRTCFFQHDEIRTLNWDDGDMSRGLTPGRIIADNVTRCAEIVRRRNQETDIWVWTDMFDEYHNAVEGNYYLVNGDLRGSADLIPKHIGMVNWNGREGIVQNSLDFFSGRGFRQISAPYYDRDEKQIRIWKEWTRETGNFHGMMYTTWQAKYDHLEAFGEYAWNHAPHIEHFPPQALPGAGALELGIRITGDRLDDGWEATAADVHYRTSPGQAFSSLPFTPAPGAGQTVLLPLPQATKWLQWHITASDNRGWSTKIPFGDTVYFELGDISSHAGARGDISDFRLYGAYPNPALSNGRVTLEFSSPPGEKVRIEMIDALGRVVKSWNDHPDAGGLRMLRLRMDGIAGGIHLLRIACGSNVRTALLSVL